MYKLLIISIFSIALAQNALQALLPPLFHTRAEFKALIDDKRLTEKLDSGEAIVSISLSENSFTVLTTQHKLLIDIIYDKTELIGPAKFHFVFHEPLALQ